jgi:ParB family transcriptional regulator, chromosome partitioning protein
VAIPAFVRAPADMGAALVAVVEENEVQTDVSAWERGRLVVLARDRGVFATVEEAVDRLFPAASRMKRARLRSFALVADELMDQFRAPERLTQREMMRLAAAIRAGFADELRLAIAGALAEQGAQWQAVLPVLAEAEGAGAGGGPRVLESANGWTVWREKVKGGFLLRFGGRDAKAEWLEPLFLALEQRFLPPAGRREIGLGRAERAEAVKRWRTG